MTPIATATNTAGTPITTGVGSQAIAITPDGKTAYVANYLSGTVTPITTATNTAGTPITTGASPAAIAITPDGKTAYVANRESATVTPIATATDTAGTPITVGSYPYAMAITPDGTTAYVANENSGTVTPITTATNTAGTPITTGSLPCAIAITPDGTTAYVVNDVSGTVTPITTATNTAGTPITVGNTPWAIAITPVPPLAAPSGLAATLAGPVSGPPSGVALTWKDNATAPAATLVRVERASDPGFSTGVTDFTAGAATTSYTDTAVVEGATYYYRVRAENDRTISGWSNPVSITFTTVPAAPASLTATVTGPVSGPPAGVSLNWTNTTSAALVTHMVVQRATDPGFTTGLADFPLGPAATSYTDPAVTEGTTYYYRVRAENEASNSDWSNTVSLLYTTVPAAPGGLTATLTGSSAVSLTWTAHTNTSPAAHLRIERATNPGFTSHVTNILIDPALSTYTDHNVAQGTSYYYRMLAQGKISDSAWSNIASIHVPWSVPSAPGNLTARAPVPVSFFGPATIDLTWTENPASAVTGFTIQSTTNPTFTTGVTTSTAGATIRKYTLAGLQQYTRYYIRIRSVNGPATSRWTTAVVTTP